MRQFDISKTIDIPEIKINDEPYSNWILSVQQCYSFFPFSTFLSSLLREGKKGKGDRIQLFFKDLFYFQGSYAYSYPICHSTRMFTGSIITYDSPEFMQVRNKIIYPNCQKNCRHKLWDPRFSKTLILVQSRVYKQT